MRDLFERLLLAVAPAVATEVTRHVLDARKRPSEPAADRDTKPENASFAAYVARRRR
jgi:hypothetical protein